MLSLLEAQARATRGVFVAVTTAAVSLLFLLVLYEALDQLALGEVVPIASVDLAPLAGSLLRRGQLLGAPYGFSPYRWVVATFCRQGGDNLPLVLLVAGPAALRGGGLLGRVSPFGAALSLCLPGAFVRQSQQLDNGLDIVHLELPHQTLVGDPLAKRHGDEMRGMVLRTWLKRWTYCCSVLPLRCLTARRSPSVPGWLNDLEKLVMNCWHSSPHEPTDPSVRFISQDLTVSLRAT
jgi:hypothetical protein